MLKFIIYGGIIKEFMDLIGEKVILKNGEIAEILAHDDKIIILCVNGVNKTYNFKISFIEGIIELVDNDLQQKVLAYVKSLMPKKMPKHWYTSASETYSKLCRDYGFKLLKWQNFEGIHCPLYAENATKEDHGVWFIAHSNWTATYDKNWSNMISGDEKVIVETYNKNTFRPYVIPFEIRVVFAKNKNGIYEFLGLYQANDKINIENKRIYERICDDYPEN